MRSIQTGLIYVKCQKTQLPWSQVCYEIVSGGQDTSEQVAYSIALGAVLQQLLLQWRREIVPGRVSQVRVSKHGECNDTVVERLRDVIRRSMHDGRSLGVSDKSERLIGAGLGLANNAIYDISPASNAANDDARARRVLCLFSIPI